MRQTPPIKTFIASVWLGSFLLYLIVIVFLAFGFQGARTHASYINPMFFITETDTGLQVIPSMVIESTDQPDLVEKYFQSTVCIVHVLTKPRKSGLFRTWSSWFHPDSVKVNPYAGHESRFGRQKAFGLVINSAVASLASSSPAEEYLELESLGLLTAMQTGKPVVYSRHISNIIYDLLTILWTVGAILSFIYLVHLWLLRKAARKVGLCKQCSYPLIDIPVSIVQCPECGCSF